MTVTATDPEGLSASQDFKVTVPNRQPRVADTIPGQQLFRGDSAMVGVAPYFSDPDGDPLTFEATSSDVSVATVSVSGDTVTVLAVASGRTTATVTAADPEGLAVSQDFEIMVPNRSPVVSDSIPDQELFRGDSARFGLMAYFADPDDDSLGFVVASSDSAVAIAPVSGATVTIHAIGQGYGYRHGHRIGPRRPRGFAVVRGGGSEPATPDIGLHRRAGVVSARLCDSRHDGLLLRSGWRLPGLHADVLGFVRWPLVSASDNGVRVSAVGVGAAAIAVTAMDPGGLSVSQTFEVTVRPADRRPARGAGTGP